MLQDKATYEVADIEKVSTKEFNVLKEYLQMYSYQGNTLVSINTTDDTGDEEEDDV